MNEHDSRRLAGQLVSQGLVPTDDARAADFILLNSCSVREKADQKVYSRLGAYRLLKAEKPHLKIGLCGCVAQREGENALARVAELDLVLGPARVGELGTLLPGLLAGERIVAVGFPEVRTYDLDTIRREESAKGMVTVIEGCDKRCTFCVVPSTRGPERCRPLADVIRETEHLLALGFREIELLGQTVNHWKEPGRPELDFADLLDAVAPLPNLRRLRFVTTFPRDFTPRMVDCLRRHRNICDYLHLPVQSGSDRVLRRMGRGYEIASYLELVASIREARPTVALSTDLIVGFPGESDEDFEATLSLIERVRFSALFAFRYSPRPGTAALKLKHDEIPDDVADRRLQRLNDLHNRIQAEINATHVGRMHEVVVTGYARGEEDGKTRRPISGRTSCNRIVHFHLPATAPERNGSRPSDARNGNGSIQIPRIGDFVEVEIDRALPHSLLGTMTATAEDHHPVGAVQRFADSPSVAGARPAPRLPVLA